MSTTLPTTPGLYWAQGIIKYPQGPRERLDLIEVVGAPPFLRCYQLPRGGGESQIVSDNPANRVWTSFMPIPKPLAILTPAHTLPDSE